MVKNFNINPERRNAETAAKLMAQQKRYIGAICRSGYEGIVSMSGIDESLEIFEMPVRLRFETVGSS